jgi:hypothetical protein
VAALESQMAEVIGSPSGSKRPKDWRRTLGRFTGDDVMRRIDDEALKYREEDRVQSRDAQG